MDRDSYDARSHTEGSATERSARLAIAYAPTQPGHARRGPRSVRGSERDYGSIDRGRGRVRDRANGHASHTGRLIGLIAVAAGIAFAWSRIGLIGTARHELRLDDIESDRADSDERLVRALNDAYERDREHVRLLKDYTDATRGLPPVREPVLDELERTRQHAKVVRKCIRLLDRVR